MKEFDQAGNLHKTKDIEFSFKNNMLYVNRENSNTKMELELLQNEREHLNEIDQLITNNKKLLAIIAHDIKGPIGSIIGFLNILKDKIRILDKDEIERYVNIALLSATKSYTLVDDLLEWAFAENAVKSLQQEEVNLNDLINKELEHIKFFAETKHIKISAENIFHEKILVDKNMIRTVFRNLLTNAVKYTYVNGKIALNTKKVDGFIEVSIKDNGMGMSQEAQELIFSENSYNSTLGTGNEKGTGFGLMLCKEFINAHGGKIWIISKPGMGSEFRFTVPIKNNTQ